MADHAAYIVIQGPGHNDTRIALREGITSFGRLPSNDVILLGDLVSRNHARIIFFDGKASLQDLGSHNGSWVNEERIATRALNPGDALRIGNFKVTFLRGVAGDAIADFVDEATGTASEGQGMPDVGRNTARAAASISACVASGRAYSRFVRMVSWNRCVSCVTMPIWSLSESSVTSRRSWPSMRIRPPVGSYSRGIM